MRRLADDDGSIRRGRNGVKARGRRTRAPGNGWNVHPLGAEASHLDIDLTSGRRVQQITRLLEACLGERDCAQWTLACRLQALLSVALAGNDPSLTLTARCASSQCGQPMEIELDLRGFVSKPCDDGFDCTPDDSTVVSLRLPNAVDQERWRGEDLAGGEDSLRVMAGSLITAVDGKAPASGFVVPEVWMNGLAAALEARDPLTCLELDADCPHCGERSSIPLDLEYCLLERLRREQRGLLDEVHCLASAYHWSEATIVELPRWRRALYLARVREESGR
jgi:hypothetical protein